MNAGVATISGFALVIGGWLWWHRDAPKTTCLLFLIAGLGVGGTIGSMVGSLLNSLFGTVGTTTGSLLGIGATTVVGGLAVVATLEVVVKGMWPKKAQPRRWHPWLALMLPTIVIATGVPLLTQVMTVFSTGVGNAGAAIVRLSNGG